MLGLKLIYVSKRGPRSLTTQIDVGDRRQKCLEICGNLCIKVYFSIVWTKERISLRICEWKFDLKRFDERSNTVMKLWRRFCVETKVPNQSTGGKVEGWDVTYGIISPTATCLPRVWGDDRMIETMAQSNCPLRSITMLKFAPMLYI